MTDRWFYAEEGKRYGPETLEALLVLFSRNPDWEQILVWRDGFEKWKRAEDVADISAQIRMPPPLPQEAPHTLAITPPPIPDERMELVQPKLKKNLAALPTAIAFGVVIVAAVLGQMIGKPIGREASSMVMGSPKTNTEAIEQGFARAETEVRPTLPKKVDEITTLVGITHSGPRLRYELVVDAGKGRQLPADFISRMKKEVAPKVCASNMKSSLDLGASYEYNYRDQTQSLLGSFVLIDSDCASATPAPVSTPDSLAHSPIAPVSK